VFRHGIDGDQVLTENQSRGTTCLRCGSNNEFIVKEDAMGPTPKPRDIPDSLPKRDTGTDVIPDDVRRTDPAQRVPPDSLPPMEEQKSVERG
jgi:hypothetical protein